MEKRFIPFEKEIPWLIVGGGISGVCLFYHLTELGEKVILMDNKLSNCSSRKAIGLVNPFIIKKLSLCWQGAEAFEFALKFFRKLEEKFRKKFISFSPLYRVFLNSESAQQWKKIRELHDERYDFMGLIENRDIMGKRRKCASVPHIFRVNPSTFFLEVEDYFKTSIFNQTFIFNNLHASSDGYWIYNNQLFKGIIFCEGKGILQNPFFKTPIVRLNKGQWIRVNYHWMREPIGILGKVFILPDQGTYLVGSTYEFNFDNNLPDEYGRRFLLESFLKLGNQEPVVLEHKSGIRPTGIDRRPILGQHPNYPGIFVFNGLGSRGFLHAPWLGQTMAHYLKNLKNDVELPADIDIGRFKGYRVNS